ncbi:MAG: ankyrin repeat domain-containing protein [Candidatus Anstonellales archaeon]
MEVKDKEKEGFDSKGGKKEAAGEGMKEERRLSDKEVFRRVLEAVRSRKEDEEAFEELRRINRERKGEDKRRAERLGEELINECRKEKEKISLERIVKLVLEGADVNVKDNDGWTALMMAADKGHGGVVEVLIKAGADVDFQNKKYELTALIVAAENGHEKIVEMLIKAGADPFICRDHTPAYECTKNEKIKKILEKRERKRVEEVIEDVRKWKERGRKEGEKPQGLERAFMWAAARGCTELIDELIDVVNVNYKSDGITMLMIASWSGHEKIVEMLIKAGADVNATSYLGFTALMYAAENGHEKIVEMLIKAGANLDLQDNDGRWTPLMWAVARKHKEVVKTLIKAGADPFIRDDIGRTAYYLNLQVDEDKEIEEMLREYIEDVNSVLDKIDKGKGLNEEEEEMINASLRIVLRNCDKRAGRLVEWFCRSIKK